LPQDARSTKYKKGTYVIVESYQKALFFVNLF
jgi:hypothetical protein